jgi:squalene-hopene/tetraprenyl-beta-curcumene cyclase
MIPSALRSTVFAVVAVSSLTVLWLLGPAAVGSRAVAGEQVGAPADKIAAARKRAAEFLRASQLPEGGWTSPEAPGVSGLVVYSLLRSGVSPDDPMVAKGLAHLLSFRQPTGGIHNPKASHGNYETSIVLLALSAANKEGRHDAIIASAKEYLVKLQWDGSEGIDRSDVKFGGAGYGKTGDRPDLSNTAFLLEALKAAGLTEKDEALQHALVFVSRCQNLETEANTTPFAAKVNDGGFYYTPAAGGNSQAGPTENGGLRSYASMTYAGLKSMIYAGVKPDDPRVKAAKAWLAKHYTMTENPGMGQQGLFYYHHTIAKALHAVGEPTFVDDKGVSHDWRRELGTHVLSLQGANGGWVNKEPRWYEGDPNMATAYALLTLSYCGPVAGK